HAGNRGERADEGDGGVVDDDRIGADHFRLTSLASVCRISFCRCRAFSARCSVSSSRSFRSLICPSRLMGFMRATKSSTARKLLTAATRPLPARPFLAVVALPLLID